MPKKGQVDKANDLLGWNTRRCELEQKVLRIFNNEKGKGTLSACINFDLYSCSCEKDPKKGRFTLSFSNGANSKKFLLRVDSDKEAHEWVKAIIEHIAASDGHKQAIMAPMTEYFYKSEQITEE